MDKCCCAGISNTQKAHLLIIGRGRVERVGGVSFVLLAGRERWCFECIDACWERRFTYQPKTQPDAAGVATEGKRAEVAAFGVSSTHHGVFKHDRHQWVKRTC